MNHSENNKPSAPPEAMLLSVYDEASLQKCVKQCRELRANYPASDWIFFIGYFTEKSLNPQQLQTLETQLAGLKQPLDLRLFHQAGGRPSVHRVALLNFAAAQLDAEVSLWVAPPNYGPMDWLMQPAWAALRGKPAEGLRLGTQHLSRSAQGGQGLAAWWRQFVWQIFSPLNHAETLQAYHLSAGLAQDLARLEPIQSEDWLAAAEQYQLLKEVLPLAYQAEAEASAIKQLSNAWRLGWRRKWRYFMREPFRKDLKSLQAKESPYFRPLFVVLTLFACLSMWYLSGDYGITGDEVDQKNYGEHVVAYYDSKGQDTRYREALPILQYYGGFFDYYATRLNQIFSKSDIYDVRHAWNSFFGFLMMFFAGLMGRLVSGSWLVACLALSLAYASPRLFGDSMNNPKDIPFGAGFMMGIYYLLLFVKHLPTVHWRALFWFMPAVGIAVGVRAGGLLLLPYLLFFAGLPFLFRKDLRWQLGPRFLPKLALRLAPPLALSALGGYWLGTLYWPYAQLDFWRHPWEALSVMTNYSVGIRILFGGEMVWSDNIPWNYLPEWLLISTPIVVLLGLVLSFGLLVFPSGRSRVELGLFLSLLWFAALFPIVYAIYKKSNLYDGMRHFLFIYPVFPVLAAWGWGLLLRSGSGLLKFGGAVACLALMALPLYRMWTWHPYQYVYFNELSGGIERAFSAYETDYWMTSMRRSAAWLIENEPAIKKGDTVYVSTNCYPPVKHYFSAYPNVVLRYTNYHDREKAAWEYGLFYGRFLDPKFLQSGVWPSQNAIHIERMGTIPLGAVLKNPYPQHGGQAMNVSTTDPNTSIALFETLVTGDPKNESAWLLLAQVALQAGELPRAKSALDSLFLLSDEYVNGLSILGVYYLQNNQIDSAKITFERGAALNYKYPFGYYQLARIAQSRNDLQEALRNIELFDQNGGKPDEGYNLALQVAQALGDQARLAYFQARAFFLQNKANEGYNMLQQAVSLNKTYQPALKLKAEYDKMIEQQRKEQARQKRR